MEITQDRASVQRLARITGGFYLSLAVLGMFGPLMLDAFVTPGDAAATAADILDARGLFRADLVSWVLLLVADTAVGVGFYLLLRPVSRALSLFAAAVQFAYVAMLGANLLHLFDAYALLTDPDRGVGLDEGQRQVAALLELESFTAAFALALVFFGVRLLVLGYLLYRSRYVPRLLAGFVVAGGAGYILDNLASLLVPDHGGVVSAVLILPPLVGELWLTGWLLVKGVKPGRGVTASRQTMASAV